ncbi:MAG: hypothetical protein ABJB09_00450 [Verrucomicrobiota bacterium]
MSASDVVLVFDWDTTQRRRLTIAGFLLASVLLHAFCFYVFQIIYPPAVALLPPPGRVSVIAPNSEENRVLLRWIKAEDPALASNTQLPADRRFPALPVVQHAPSYLTRQPTLKELAPLKSDLRVPSARPPAAVERRREQRPVVATITATAIRFSEEFETLGSARVPEMKFAASTHESPQAAHFSIAANENGEVRFCFLQISSGDPQLDEQARNYLVLSRFSPIANRKSQIANDFIWGTATIEWGNDIALPPPANVAP